MSDTTVTSRRRYVSSDEDSARWDRFPFRRGDIVISTRSKSGTTWMQMICALLVFRRPDLPQPLGELSPWLDWLVEPRAAVVERLEAQRHRRIIKTHTPLDGLPLDPRATFVVVARDPLDTGVSLYHQGDNIDRRRLAELTGSRSGDPRSDPRPAPDEPRPPLGDWLRTWIAWDGDPAERLDSVPGIVGHVSDAWTRRRQANVILVHYADLGADLVGQMVALARRIGVDVGEREVRSLAAHATFDSMRARSDELVPDRRGVLRDPQRFFRSGRSGAGAALLTEDELDAYRRRVQRLAGADVLTWLHRWDETTAG